MFLRIVSKFFDVLKSLSFLQSFSQEEPLTSPEHTSNLNKAIQFLTKAAESENSDALFLLGELNFVSSDQSWSWQCLVRKLLQSKLSRRIQMAPETSSERWKFHSATSVGIYVCYRNWQCRWARSRGGIFWWHSSLTPGVIISYIRCAGRQYAFRNDSCLSSSHGYWHTTELRGCSPLL